MIMCMIKRLILIFVLCSCMCLTACSERKLEETNNKKNTLINNEDDQDNTKLDSSLSENQNMSNNSENEGVFPEYYDEAFLRIEGKEYNLTIEEVEKINNIFLTQTMIQDDEGTESYCPYEFLIGNSSYSVTEDFTQIEASVADKSGEYDYYVKCTNEDEQRVLKSILSNYIED